MILPQLSRACAGMALEIFLPPRETESAAPCVLGFITIIVAIVNFLHEIIVVANLLKDPFLEIRTDHHPVLGLPDLRKVGDNHPCGCLLEIRCEVHVSQG